MAGSLMRQNCIEKNIHIVNFIDAHLIKKWLYYDCNMKHRLQIIQPIRDQSVIATYLSLVLYVSTHAYMRTA